MDRRPGRAALALALILGAAAGARAEVAIDDRGNARVEVPRTCILATDSPEKSIAELTGLLLDTARREALRQVAGELAGLGGGGELVALASATTGAVLIPLGSPRFSNGAAFGELCVEAVFGATKADLARLRPETIAVAEHCYTNKAVPLAELKDRALEEAAKGALVSINPALGNLPAAELMGLVREIRGSSERVDMNTLSYCGDYQVTVLRLEVEHFMPATVAPRIEQTAAAAAKLAPGEVFRDCETCPRMVVIPAGSFEMGSVDGFDSERPAHPVTVPRDFALGVYEVSFAEWGACVADGDCRFARNDRGWGRQNRPVIDVNWDDAAAFVSWLQKKTNKRYRLPSEAEWEYAARAGTLTPYSFGDKVGEGDANFGKQVGKTRPVGSYPANPFGLHDMNGNVWEWVEDCWHDGYRGAPGDARAWTARGNCRGRVLRGGAWLSDPAYLRSAYRIAYVTVIRNYYIGFRVARTLTR